VGGVILIFRRNTYKKHGGALLISDIDLDHLANSAFAAQLLQYPINIAHGDAIHYIERKRL